MNNWAILFLGLIAVVEGRQVDVERRLRSVECPFDYFPCVSCFDNDHGFVLSCEDVTENRLEEIFRNTNVDRPFSIVKLIGNFTKLSANLIGNNMVERMSIEWKGSAPVLVDRDFMRSSENFTTRFGFHCQGLGTTLNMSFLEHFSKLKELYLIGSISRLESMPSLESLKELNLHCPSLDQLYEPKLTPSLTRITLTNNKKLDFLLGFNETLTQLSASGLEEIPTEVNAMSRLTHLYLYGTGTLLRSNSLTAMANLSFVTIYFPLETIEEGAFQGDFSNTYMQLTTNGLRRFEEGVFRRPLESMVDNGGDGLFSLRYYGSYFECDCHLAWLIRDHRRLLSRISDGKCSNGAYFESLLPEDFINCSEDSSTVPSSSTTPSTPLSSSLGPSNVPSSSPIPSTSISTIVTSSSVPSTILSTSSSSTSDPSTIPSTSSSAVVTSSPVHSTLFSTSSSYTNDPSSSPFSSTSSFNTTNSSVPGSTFPSTLSSSVTVSPSPTTPSSSNKLVSDLLLITAVSMTNLVW